MKNDKKKAVIDEYLEAQYAGLRNMTLKIIMDRNRGMMIEDAENYTDQVMLRLVEKLYKALDRFDPERNETDAWVRRTLKFAYMHVLGQDRKRAKDVLDKGDVVSWDEMRERGSHGDDACPE